MVTFTHTPTPPTGSADIDTMARAAREAGLDHLAITDHTQSLAMAKGLDEHGALAHAHATRAANDRIRGITLLAGIEYDIRADGALNLADDCPAELDLVIASVHSAFGQDERQMTNRILRAIDSPHVNILGHLTGRRLLRREPYRVDIEQVVDAAARLGVALEINCQVERLDLCDTQARLARDRGAPIVISSDAHAPGAFAVFSWGVVVARRAWLEPNDVLNTLPLDAFRRRLRRHRPAAPQAPDRQSP